MVGAGVDERGAAALDDQVGGVEVRPVEAGVDAWMPCAEPFDEVAEAQWRTWRIDSRGATVRSAGRLTARLARKR